MAGVDAGGGGERGRELHTGHAGRDQHLLLVRGETVHLRLDELPEGLRRARRHVLHRAGQAPAPFELTQAPLMDQVVDGVDQEEGVALGAPMQHAGELRRQRVAGGSAGRGNDPPPRAVQNSSATSSQ
jgi:hypothetical protein